MTGGLTYLFQVLRIELLYSLPGYEAQGLPKKLGKFNFSKRKLQVDIVGGGVTRK